MSERTIEGALFERKSEVFTPAELALFALQLQLELNSVGTSREELIELGERAIYQLDSMCNYGGKEIEVSGPVTISELDPESEGIAISTKEVQSLQGISHGFGYRILPVIIDGHELEDSYRLQFTHMFQVDREPRVQFMPFARIEAVPIASVAIEDSSIEVVDETGPPDLHTLEALYSEEMEEVDAVIFNSKDELEATANFASEVAPSLIGADEDMLLRVTRYLNSTVIFKRHTPAFVSGVPLLYSVSSQKDGVEYRPLQWKDGYFAYLEQFTLMPATKVIGDRVVQDNSRQQLALKLGIISDDDERVPFVIPLADGINLRAIS
ncbi:hypothetical protein CYG49_04500 [Candidatus Saccharibacteria bacterium]|nr:MAG: hypothetical protein CYG49_04500 [Candidatus Saccharibacteria bacterium]